MPDAALPPIPRSRAWTASDTERPRSLNAERSGHWRTHRAQTEADRDRWRILWLQAFGADRPHLDACWVVALPSYKRSPQDTGNCYPTVKAAVDALVDLAVIPDDTGEYVHGITLLAPSKDKTDGLFITLLDASDDPAPGGREGLES